MKTFRIEAQNQGDLVEVYVRVDGKPVGTLVMSLDEARDFFRVAQSGMALIESKPDTDSGCQVCSGNRYYPSDGEGVNHTEACPTQFDHFEGDDSPIVEGPHQ